MAKVITDNINYSNIADAIRVKLGVETLYTPSQMKDAINNIAGYTATLSNKIIYFNDMNGYIIDKNSYFKPIRYRRDINTSEEVLDIEKEILWGNSYCGKTYANNTIGYGFSRWLDTNNFSPLGENGFTIGGWFMQMEPLSSLDDISIALVCMGDNGMLGLASILSEDGVNSLLSFGAAGSTLLGSITLNEWFHLALTVEKDSDLENTINYTIYKNGMILASYTATGNLDFSLIEISDTVDGSYWGGAIKNIFASNEPLTDDEIRLTMLSEVALTKTSKLQEKTVLENGRFTADSGYDGLSAVNVQVENGVEAILNIAFGEEPPETTSKLWIKTEEPDSQILITPQVIGQETFIQNEAVIDSEVVSLLNNRIAVSTGDSLYFIGFTTEGNYNVGRIYKYDIKTKVFTYFTNTSVSYPGTINSATVLDNKIYLYASTDKQIEIIDIDTKASQVVSTSTTGGTMIPIEKDIYIFGNSSIYRFNTISQSTSNIGKFNGMVSQMAIAAVGTNVYLFGGTNSTGTLALGKSDIYIFDTITGTAKKAKATLPAYTYNFSGQAVGNNIYLFGGRNNGNSSSSKYNTILKYDIEKDTIQTLPVTLKENMEGVKSIAAGNSIYVYGSNYSNNLAKLVVNQELEKDKILIQTDAIKNSIEIVKGKASIQTGIKQVYKGNINGFAEPIDAYQYKSGVWVRVS